jgi:hypothetical protein
MRRLGERFSRWERRHDCSSWRGMRAENWRMYAFCRMRSYTHVICFVLEYVLCQMGFDRGFTYVYDETTWCRGYMNEKDFHDTMSCGLTCLLMGCICVLQVMGIAGSSSLSSQSRRLDFMDTVALSHIANHSSKSFLSIPHVNAQSVIWPLAHVRRGKLNNAQDIIRPRTEHHHHHHYH